MVDGKMVLSFAKCDVALGSMITTVLYETVSTSHFFNDKLSSAPFQIQTLFL